MSTKIEQGALVTRMLAEGKKPEEIIEEVYLRSLTRKPTAEEVKQLLGQVNSAGDNAKEKELILNDVFWAVLNSKEFMFNH